MFYDPSNVTAVAGAKSVREAARQLHVEVVERHVASAEELRLGFQALQAREFDAFLNSEDGMVTSQAQFIIDVARTKRLPTMFSYPSSLRKEPWLAMAFLIVKLVARRQNTFTEFSPEPVLKTCPWNCLVGWSWP